MKANKIEIIHAMRRYALALMTLALLTGCTTLPESTKPAKGLSAPDTRVTLRPGDTVEVKFFYSPELNDSQVIRPDGMISLQLVGDVMVAGRSPSQVQRILRKKYTGIIDKPSVTVVVRELYNRSIFIDGAVKQPGMLKMPGNMTLLSAIIKAGGFDLNTAAIENVVVIRRENGKRQSFCLDLKDALSGEKPHEPFYLHAQDIVFVPRTRIVNMGQWIDQHINKMVPQFGFTYFYTTGNSTIGLDTSSNR